MADPAILIRVKFCIDKGFMNVGMAIAAISSDRFKRPSGLFIMTFGTGLGGMCTFEGKITFVMLFNGVRKSCKTYYTVAHRAIRGNTTFCKLSFMIVGMTIVAAIIFQGIREPCFMACFTIDIKMFIQKRELRFTMIKITDPFDYCERFIVMAPAAIPAELILMWIFMAICT